MLYDLTYSLMLLVMRLADVIPHVTTRGAHLRRRKLKYVGFDMFNRHAPQHIFSSNKRSDGIVGISRIAH